MSKRAKIISIADQSAFLAHVADQCHSSRNTVIALLGFKAGLRACEIASLGWSMALGALGRVDEALTIADYIAKKGSSTRILCCAALRKALEALHAEPCDPSQDRFADLSEEDVCR